MADLLYALLRSQQPEASSLPPVADEDALEYLRSLSSQPLASLESAEAQNLSQASQSLLLSLQALSKRSHKPIIESAAHHATLHSTLPALAQSAADLRHAIQRQDNEVVRFSTTYNKSSENKVLTLRKKTHLLARNVERAVDVLEQPTLLSSAISTAPVNYSSALDLTGHIRRLHSLYPKSPLVDSISAQADAAMRAMATSLVVSLKASGLKLAASLRTISWLRRVLPDLEVSAAPGEGRNSQERVLGALFLVCRLATLMAMLAALEPLRELAEQEKTRQEAVGAGSTWSGGQQPERYLKRYNEIFREQRFAIVSMFRSIFPAPPPTDDPPMPPRDPLEPLPSALATFPLYLVDMLLETLRLYLPTVKDQASRDSLLTQVLFCEGSSGRLGGDFGLFLSGLDVGSEAED